MTSAQHYQDATPKCSASPARNNHNCHFLVHKSQMAIQPALVPIRTTLSPASNTNSYAIDVQGKNAHTSGLSKLRSEAAAYPAWFDELDLVDIDFCSPSEFASVFASAPSQFTQGMLYGKLTLRIHHSAITGREQFGHTSRDMRELIRDIDTRLIALKDTFPEWFSTYEFVDPDFCTRIELEEMMLCAPINFIKGMLFGKLSTRIQMASLTGREFGI